MKFASLLIPTLREDPAEAEIPSHRLMLRAGLMRKVAGGIYTHLPLGLRTLQKIMAIIREELDAIGCQELLLPIMQPAELWHETGRWAQYGDEMFRLQDRHGRQFCLGPTHEEIITALVRSEVRSYRQLPLILYQIQNKYRDEIRPRFGVMRAREFIMKDAYSFDRDEAGLDASYEAMYKAYQRIFARCGLETRAVLADPGAIGGNDTHEFMVLAETGEAAVVYCDRCDYAANVEKAETKPTGPLEAPSPPPVEKVHTPGVRTIDELVSFLGAPPERMIKTLVYVADGVPVVALVRGDRELNEVKLARALGADVVAPADPETIKAVMKAPAGSLGPVGLSCVRVVGDYEVAAIADGITGANEEDFHLVHVAFGRDYTCELFDLRLAVAGDPCPRCEGRLHQARGIEVGQVFKLGTKYSKALNATFLDENGEERLFIMGCYGIGVTRTMAAIIEQHHDERGICWPMSVAPFHAVLIVINPADAAQLEAANSLYDALGKAGIEVVLDDRDERPGVKFNDADLIGFPIRLVVGPKLLAEGKAELKLRASGEVEIIPLEQVVERVKACVDAGLAAH